MDKSCLLDLVDNRRKLMRIIHISDIHLPNNRGDLVYGKDPYLTVEKALMEIKNLNPEPDLVVLGGDLLNDGTNGNYSVAKDIFEKHNVPISAAVLGNHDDLYSFIKNPPFKLPENYNGYYSFCYDNYHFIMLFSATTGRGYGHLDVVQLKWLEKELKNTNKSVIIFMHHPPVEIGIPWLDKINLVNNDAFWEILSPFKGLIKGVFAAHIHISLSMFYNGVYVCSSPGICSQFDGNTNALKAQISDEDPGFNIIDLTENSVICRTKRFPSN